jgi:hypothetical protein
LAVRIKTAADGTTTTAEPPQVDPPSAPTQTESDAMAGLRLDIASLRELFVSRFPPISLPAEKTESAPAESGSTSKPIDPVESFFDGWVKSDKP